MRRCTGLWPGEAVRCSALPAHQDIKAILANYQRIVWVALVDEARAAAHEAVDRGPLGTANSGPAPKVAGSPFGAAARRSGAATGAAARMQNPAFWRVSAHG